MRIYRVVRQNVKDASAGKMENPVASRFGGWMKSGLTSEFLLQMIDFMFEPLFDFMHGYGSVIVIERMKKRKRIKNEGKLIVLSALQ